MRAYTELKERLAEVHDLDRARAVLGWDERTMMPAGGAGPRAEQLATLTGVIHARATSDDVGLLLDELQPWAEAKPYESEEAALIRVARRDFDKARRVPGELRAEMARAASAAQHAWEDARARSDFSRFLPHLERNVELTRRYAGCFESEDPYDALLDDYEPGMSTDTMAALLDRLKETLVPLAAAIADHDDAAEAPPTGRFPVERQRRLVASILSELPMTPEHYRLDPTTHPFAMGIAPTDVRLTTRYDEQDLFSSLFSAIHEYGHGLYENGIARELERTPLGEVVSLGLHESQSRLWENGVGRSRPFWRRFFPRLAEAFPDELAGYDPERLFRAVNRVEPSLIRTEADEVTYDLHVILRFELEREIIAGRLDLAELPAAWNERVAAYLGVEVPDDASGVLQDVHWAGGAFGYFPTYSLGNVIAGQIRVAAYEALPDLDERIERGDFDTLREWLRENVHRHGRTFSAGETVERITGGPIDPKPYLRYLEEKMGEIYGLD